MQPNETPAAPASAPAPAPAPVTDLKPIEPAAPAPAGKSLWKIFSIISIGALAIAVVAGVLTVLNITNTKDAEIVNLKNQVVSLESQIASMAGPETDPNQKFVEFPGLGVRVPVSDELAEKISIEEVEAPGALAAYSINYGTCKGGIGVLFSSSLTATMGADAPNIVLGDIWTAFIPTAVLTCDTTDIDIAAFTADNQAWLKALENIEAYEFVNEEAEV